MKRPLILCIKLLLVIAIFFWLIRSGQLNLNILVNALSPLATVAGVLCVGLGFYFAIERLRTLLAVFSVQISLAKCLQFFLIGLFFNFVLPGGVGGDVVKGYYIYREHPTNRRMSVLAVLIDRLVGLFTIFFIASITVFIDSAHLENPILLRIAQICVATTVLICLTAAVLFYADTEKLADYLLTRWPFLKKRLVHAVLEAVHKMFSSPGLVLKSFAFSLCAQVLFMLTLYIAGQALGFTTVPLHGYFFIGAIGFLISAVPITPAGIGVGQAAFLFVSNAYIGESTILGPSIITFYQIISLLWALVGGVIYLQIKRADIPADLTH